MGERRAGEAAAEAGVVGGGDGDARHEAVERTLEGCDQRNTGRVRVRISTGVTGTTADPLPPVEHDSWAEGIVLGSDSAYGIAVISSATGPSGSEPMAARSGTRKSTDLINTGRCARGTGYKTRGVRGPAGCGAQGLLQTADLVVRAAVPYSMVLAGSHAGIQRSGLFRRW